LDSVNIREVAPVIDVPYYMFYIIRSSIHVGHKLIMLAAKKKRGRPATGHDPVVRLRMSVEKQAEVLAWGERNGIETFSRAIRHLIDQGLKRDLPKRRGKAKPSEGQ
jgi:hypothetical protein